ncbi:hypothetical protein HMN09_01008000 [Mycena chlorophos]|uniref:Uncharacterized protein n=1 Tax=Mycena chlorophos TaxID=658473 RepID=A0A8H6VXX3_MYCCL|nr:hypothetical protein HMN09_01008000 [Mycena chlorophos]
MAPLYAPCPSCGEWIPAALLCRGTIHPNHKGLCASHATTFVGSRRPNPTKSRLPGPMATIFHATTTPSPPPSVLANFPNLNIDPALLDMDPPPPLSSQPRRTSLPSPMPTLAPQDTPQPAPSLSSAPKCAVGPCTRRWTCKKCTNFMCSQCCKKKNNCDYAQHCNNATVSASNGNPAASARPPPVIPSTTSSSRLGVDQLDLSPSKLLATKTHRKPMDTDWQAMYEAGIQKQQRRQREEDQKRVVKHADEEPEHLRQQDLPFFPNFNLSHHERLLKKMGLSTDDEIFVFNTEGFWVREDVNTTFAIRARANNAHPPHQRAVSRLRISIPSPISSPSSPSLYSFASPPPVDDSISPATTMPPSPSPSTINLTTSRGETIDLTWDDTSTSVAVAGPSVALLDGDELWKQGRVVVPDTGRWPTGMYTRDMAFAFKQIGSGKGEAEVEERFGRLFPGVKWVKATFYRQQGFWRNSTQVERETCGSLPRATAGLWTRVRKDLTGYKVFMDKDKVKKV